MPLAPNHTNQSFQSGSVSSSGVRFGGRAEGVARHRDRQSVRRRLHPGEYAPQRRRSRVRLWFATVGAVCKLEQRLADRVRVRDRPVVDKRDVADAPAEQGPCHRAAQRAGAQQQAPRGEDGVGVELGQQPPAHELQIKVD